MEAPSRCDSRSASHAGSAAASSLGDHLWRSQVDPDHIVPPNNNLSGDLLPTWRNETTGRIPAGKGAAIPDDIRARRDPSDYVGAIGGGPRGAGVTAGLEVEKPYGHIRDRCPVSVGHAARNSGFEAGEVAGRNGDHRYVGVGAVQGERSSLRRSVDEPVRTAECDAPRVIGTADHDHVSGRGEAPEGECPVAGGVSGIDEAWIDRGSWKWTSEELKACQTFPVGAGNAVVECMPDPSLPTSGLRVRHPARGGATLFRAQLGDLVRERGLA